MRWRNGAKEVPLARLSPNPIHITPSLKWTALGSPFNVLSKANFEAPKLYRCTAWCSIDLISVW